jgi:hypothetical protein
MADEQAKVTADLAELQAQADSLKQQQQRLDADRAAFGEERARYNVRRAAFETERLGFDQERLAFDQERAAFRRTAVLHEQDLDHRLATHDLELIQYRKELEGREVRVVMREMKLAELEQEFQIRNTELSNRQGVVEANERDLAARQEANRVGMHRLKTLVDDHFTGK